MYLRKFMILLTGVVLVSGCGRMRLAPTLTEPIIRVGILEDQDAIYFEAAGDFSIIAQDAKESAKAFERGLWKASVHALNTGAERFTALLYESQDKSRAEEFASRLRDRGLEVEIKSRGEALQSGGRTLVDRRNYRVFVDRTFVSKAEAESFLKGNGNLQGRILRDMEQTSIGKIALLSPNGHTQLISDALRLSGTPITLRNVEVGSGYHWARNETRTYGGEIELRISAAGKLSAINVVEIELYLRGVVAGEMANSFPSEALKAQAIVSRTLFFNTFGRFHRDSDFDVCDDVHCQAYVGLIRNSEAVENAVHDTKGLVLTFHDELCTASYSAVCGGHTANASEVWDSDGEPYLQGVLDTRKDIGKFDLSNEENARIWIQGKPDVCCNLEMAGRPDFGRYAEKYFRWEQKISNAELRKSVLERTGVDVGEVVDITPVKRGVSGRLAAIDILGIEDHVVVKKELNIRRALSPTALYSACFIVAKETNAAGGIDTFVFKGAGWGHGVGLCQLGAAVRAQEGQKVSEIVQHYYPGTVIKQLY